LPRCTTENLAGAVSASKYQRNCGNSRRLGDDTGETERVVPGDRARVSLSPYDLSHGQIVFCYREPLQTGSA
jgi:hypothetical protein